jgi:hypothetical protein
MRFLIDEDPDPDPTSHLNTDSELDPDPRFQIRAQTLKKVLIFHTFWLVICKLMGIRIRIQLITLIRIRILIFV